MSDMSSAIAPMIPMGTPYAKGSPTESFPISSSETKPFFPPVCLKTHWDPTMIYSRSVPTSYVPLPLDFRPYTKVCLEYRTSAPEQKAPEIADNVVFPQGGEVYPPDRYLRAVDKESLLRRLDRPLGTCDEKEYEPPQTSDMYVDRMLVPKSNKPPSRFVEEISMPSALLRAGTYHCRAEADEKNWSRSTRLFNNATKQDRYKGPTEPPRQNIWSDPRRCATSGPTEKKMDPTGCRAWGC
jgi:hypothetical protein